MHEMKALFRPRRLDLLIAALCDIPELPSVTMSRVHAYASSHWHGNPWTRANEKAR